MIGSFWDRSSMVGLFLGILSPGAVSGADRSPDGSDAGGQTTLALFSRFVEPGGFVPTREVTVPDLLSTATALFALSDHGVKLDAVQRQRLRP